MPMIVDIGALRYVRSDKGHCDHVREVKTEEGSAVEYFATPYPEFAVGTWELEEEEYVADSRVPRMYVFRET